MAKLNLDYYQNENEYSDGPIEKEILDIIKSGVDFQEVIATDNRWPILYHLSHLRENILNWYDFKKDSSLLEIGAGCGAITGMLCDKVKKVTSVELTKDRSETIYERHIEKENLEIIVGNFHNIKFKEKFDYIVLNGVFEYAASFTKTKNPYVDLLLELKKLLKSEGILLIAIENRLGLKYFNGAKEDHTSQLFSGLDNYRYESFVKTFSQNEWIDLSKTVKFERCDFYYPFYDYKFTDMIFTDESLESIDFNFFTHAFDNERFVFFDENDIVRSLINEGVYGKFANSFLVELRLNNKTEEKRTIFAKISNQRKKDYQIVTKIISENNKKYVVKEGLTPQSVLHIKNMLCNQNNTIDGFQNIKVVEIDNGIKMDFIDSITFEDKLINFLKINARDEFEAAIKDFSARIKKDSILTNEYCRDEFKVIFGSTGLSERMLCKENLNIDMLFSNIFLEGNVFEIIDYEWIFKFLIPVDFVIWRSINMFYYCNSIVARNYTYEELLEIAGIKDKTMVNVFESWNQFFGYKYVGVEQFNQYEKDRFLLTNYSENILSQNKVETRLHYDTGYGFNINQAFHSFNNIKDGKMDLFYSLNEVKENIVALRWDPCENYCRIRNLKIESDLENLRIFPINGTYETKGWIYFLTNDPIYMIEGSLNNVKKIRVNCDIKKLTKKEIELVSSIVLKRKEEETVVLKEKEKIMEKEHQELEIIKNSSVWKMTKPLRFTLDKTKYYLKKSKNVEVFYKGIKNIKNNGVEETLKKTKNFLLRQKEIKKFKKETGMDLNAENSLLYSGYESDYQDNIDFSSEKTDIKAITFYLPQFHRIKENDEWWGEGFTEWTNTSKTSPRFEGHYQPRTPHSDIGYYDLSKIETLKKQIELAKQHGVYGFCFYYYWFSGRRIMEKPVDMLLEHPEIDFNFCLCWANENFTRAWDGLNKEVLLGQSYSKDDRNKFIDDIKKYTDDRRYIRINGKPLIIVYNPGEIPDIKETFAAWRSRADEVGIGEILIWTCQTANNTASKLKIENYIDGELEFPPHNMWYDIIGVRDINLNGKEACIYNYRKLVDILGAQLKESSVKNTLPLHKTAMLGWDNAARRDNNWTTFLGYSLKSFYQWLTLIIDDARNNFDESNRFVFINAWNEWAEGTYLEPDEKYGYANINTLSKALFDIPFDEVKVLNKKSSIEIKESSLSKLNKKPCIAVQIHLYYVDTVDEIINEINKIPFKYDCYITTDTLEKKELIQTKFGQNCSANYIEVGVYENRGRDVAPFLLQLKDKIDRYEYICHIHSKKTATNNYGDGWREFLYRHIFGNTENIRHIFSIFENQSNTGLIYPEIYPAVRSQAHWGDNEKCCKELLKRLGLKGELDKDIIFPVGNMFWARTKAIEKVFKANFDFNDFPKEKGQVNQTLGHQIERIWSIVAQNNGYKTIKTFNDYSEIIDYSELKRIALYVHYDKNNCISEDDVNYIKELSSFVEQVVFITNSKISELEKQKVSPYISKIIERENIGYDFGGWRDAILSLGFEYLATFDQLLLLNNSCYCGRYDFRNVFAKMESKDVDFWGITLFPYLEDGTYIQKPCIEEHIQSYFQVFNSNVVKSSSFKEFWESIKNYEELVDVVANCETVLTKRLKDAGFKYDVFVKETRILSNSLGNYSIPYEFPYDLLILGSPFIKKKSEMYMKPIEKIKIKNFIKQLN